MIFYSMDYSLMDNIKGTLNRKSRRLPIVNTNMNAKYTIAAQLNVPLEVWVVCGRFFIVLCSPCIDRKFLDYN